LFNRFERFRLALF